MLLRAFQSNLPRKSIRYIFVVLFVVGILVLLEKDKARLTRVRTKAVLNRIQDYVEDKLDAELFEEDFDIATPKPVHKSRGPHHSARSKHGLASHAFRDDGLMEVNPHGRHPIYDLMSRAERSWNEKVARQSKTLADAVQEYKKRYQQDPPLGFRDWWNYVEANNVQLPDEYDQIYRDLEPFWGMSPSHVQGLQAQIEAEPGTYTLSNGNAGFKSPRVVTSSALNQEEVDVFEFRSQMQLQMLRNVSQWMPPFRATYNYHDAPIIFVGHDLRSEAVDAAAVQDYVDISRLWSHHRHGWEASCPSSSPLRRHPNATEFPNLHRLHSQKPKTFIYNHLRSMNPCIHYNHVHLNGQLLNQHHNGGPQPRQQHLPSFSMSSTTLHADIITATLENWVDEEDLGPDPAWEDKPHETLLWRGSTTGMVNEARRPWRFSQRTRLVEMANRKRGQYDVLPVVNPSSAVGDSVAMDLGELNHHLMDVAFFDKPSQCEGSVCEVMNEELRFIREKQSFADGNKYKYVLDVDGNGWSARFKRLMTSNSLVFKATICPEWFSERVMPWVHYVPVKMDFTDLYDILSFFHGDEGAGNTNDHLAKQIAIAGKEWSKAYWRKEDMTAYMFRLLLEWSRILSPNRDSMSFVYSDEYASHIEE